MLLGGGVGCAFLGFSYLESGGMRLGRNCSFSVIVLLNGCVSGQFLFKVSVLGSACGVMGGSHVANCSFSPGVSGLKTMLGMCVRTKPPNIPERRMEKGLRCGHPLGG